MVVVRGDRQVRRGSGGVEGPARAVPPGQQGGRSPSLTPDNTLTVLAGKDKGRAAGSGVPQPRPAPGIEYPLKYPCLPQRPTLR